MFGWAAEQSIAVQRLLFRESARVLGVALSAQQTDALVAVEACARALGRVPSRDAYRAWLREPDNFGWPSSWQIESLFDGSWANVAAALAGDVAPKFDLRAASLISQGGAFGDDELLAGIRSWWAEQAGGDPHFAKYREWAIARMREHGVDTCRYGVSVNLFRERFGGWYETLHRAGVTVTLTRAQIRALVEPRSSHERDALLQALRDAHAWAKAHGRDLTRASYDAWRGELADDAGRDAALPLPPAGGAFASHFGSLPRAMALAGTISEEEALRRVLKRGVKLELLELRAWVWAAAEDVGARVGQPLQTLTAAQYTTWRDAEQQRLLGCVPAALTLIERFEVRTFAEALAAALRERPTVELDRGER